MIKKINILPIVVFAFVLISSCGGSDDSPAALAPEPNVAPTAVGQLTYPSADLPCTESTINFQWSASTDVNGDAVSYTLTIALDRNLTNVVEQLNVTSNSRTVTLQPGTAYYWNVVAKDNQAQAAPSATFAFYTVGDGASNYAPFTAALDAPAMESFVDAGTVNLSWTGSDVNTEDTLTYDLYLAESLAGLALVQADLTVSNHDIMTEAAKTYFWRVDTKDDSGVKSIGQVWTFSTN